MRLSLCLITRNEQHNLPRALASFQGLCDQIIVADTGSTDQTPELARAMGATVVSFPWCDDFSAARNFCIQHARSDWIFWLDADEALLQESRDLLDECMNRPDVAGWSVLRQDLIDSDHTDLFTEMWQLRLFRRDEKLRFIGRCHPDFDPPLSVLAMERGMKVLPSLVRLRHWGYVTELKSAKLQRAARLLELELADRPGRLYYQIEYGRTLLALGQAEKAHRILIGATSKLLHCRYDPEPPLPMAAALLEYLLAIPAAQLPEIISFDPLCALCHRWFPRCGPLLWAISRRHFETGDFPRATGVLQRLVELGRTDSYDKMISFNPRLLHEDAVLNLAACHIRLANLDRAEYLLQPLLSTARRDEAQQNLAVIARLRKNEPAG